MSTILLVDDEEQLALSVQEFLALHGYNVVVAQSAEEGLAKLLESPPDLIISDIIMSDMDGYEFNRRVQALTGGRIPFIFLTAKVAHEEVLQGLLDGADDYITKPFDPQELLVRIENILKRVEQTRAADQEQFLTLREHTVSQWTERLQSPLQTLLQELNVAKEAGRTLGLDTLSLERALDAAHTLERVIDELEWSSVESVEKRLHPESVRVAPVVRRAAASAARKALAKGVDVKISCGGLLTGVLDEAALVRALGGLLEAVVALSLPGTCVSLAARRAPDQGLEFVITEGSAREDVPSEELSNALDIARAVILAHQGKLTAQRTPEGLQSYMLWIPGRVPRGGASDG